MGERLGHILISAEEISGRVRKLGEEIGRDYRGQELLLVGVREGAVVFLADLMRSLPIPVACDFVSVTSYGTGTTSSGTVTITSDLSQPIEGRHVLLVEDIIDTGLTLSFLQRALQERRPSSLKICALLDKAGRRKVEVSSDYVGFRIPDEFVVGYGLDYAGLYRDLPYIALLEMDDPASSDRPGRR
jgi:hypoxanthine phosphoribosyltransferase